MSRFYSDAYKWSLYEKFRNGFTLTELCKISGVTDKPLREWFRQIDSQYAQGARLSVKSVQQENAHLKLVVQQKQNELKLLNEIIADIPEAQRIFCGRSLLAIYGVNQVCHSLKIRKSNLYYRIFRRPEVTVYEKHNQELLPAIQEICDISVWPTFGMQIKIPKNRPHIMQYPQPEGQRYYITKKESRQSL